jgi:Ser/Thr protein kinase RdoA (MazF antagonist)
LIEELAKVLKEVAPSLARVANDARWPVGICHGDLHAGNLLKGSDGRIWLVDWELAGVRPVVIDLAHLYLRIPDLKPVILDILAALDPEGAGMVPVQQLALGSAFQLRKRAYRRASRIEEVVKTKGQQPSQAASDYDRATARAREAIAALSG